jgi:Fe-S cluster biogenesis protein NfuA
MKEPTSVRLAPTDRSILEELTDVRRRLRSHGGDIAIAEVNSDGDVQLEFKGACVGCPALAFTYSMVVEPAVMRVTGVKSVASRNVRSSSFVSKRVRSIRDD